MRPSEARRMCRPSKMKRIENTEYTDADVACDLEANLENMVFDGTYGTYGVNMNPLIYERR